MVDLQRKVKTLFLPVIRVLALLTVLVTGTLIAAIVTDSASKVFATPSQPPTNWSFYINSISDSTASTLGCNQGKFDASFSPPRNSEVVLDFGAENDSSGDTLSVIYNHPFSVSGIEEEATQFASGYWGCTIGDSTSVLNLGIGTNNSGLSTYASGVAWANVVKAVRNTVQANGWNSQINAIGASDIEPDFGSWSNTNSWIQGYTSINPAHYIDFGSADGCSTTLDSSSISNTCNNNWNMDNVYYASWGAAPALAAPEIFCSPQGLQWTQISLDGAQNHGSTVWYEGPWDQHDLDPNTNTSATAWNEFWNDLNGHSQTAQTPIYSLEIHWDNGWTNTDYRGC